MSSSDQTKNLEVTSSIKSRLAPENVISYLMSTKPPSVMITLKQIGV